MYVLLDVIDVFLSLIYYNLPYEIPTVATERFYVCAVDRIEYNKFAWL